MKKIFFLLAVVLLSFGCNDSDVIDRLDDLENRIAKLEERCNEMNTNISSLKSIVDVMKSKNDYITGVTPLMQDGVEVGYTITFNYNEPIVIYHGIDGKDGYAPVIGVKQDDADGIFYWTLDGEWILNAAGNKVKAEGVDGEDGADAVVPKVEIRDGYWWVVYGDKEVQLEKIPEGTVGSSIFDDVIADDAKTVTFILPDGTEIVVPKESKLAIEFSDNDILLAAGETVTINYTITGAKENALVKVIAQNGWSATVTPATANTGTITVTAPDPLVEAEVLVFVNDGDSQTIMKVINFEKGTLSAVISAQEVPVEGSNVEITVNTNTDYNVVIPDEAKSWLSVVETKAMITESVTLACAKNEGAERTAIVKMVDKSGNELSSCAILQEANSIGFGLNAMYEAMTIDIAQLEGTMTDPYLTNVYMNAKNAMYGKSACRTMDYATLEFHNYTDIGMVLRLNIRYTNTAGTTYNAIWDFRYKFNEDGTITIYDRDMGGSSGVVGNATIQEPYLRPIVDYFCLLEYSSYSASTSTPWADNKANVTKIIPRTFKLNYIANNTPGSTAVIGGFVPVDAEQLEKAGICCGIMGQW